MWSNCFHTDNAEEIAKGKPIAKWGRKVMDLLTQTARLPRDWLPGSFCFFNKEAHFIQNTRTPIPNINRIKN